MVTYSSKYVEQLVNERDLLNRKLKQQSDDLRKLGVEIDRRGFAAVGNAEAQNAWGWCSIEVEKLLRGE